MTKELTDSIILPKTHPPMYLMHKYFARKPHNIVAEYIKKYSRENEVVLDPFCGSGVTIAESILMKRKAIGVDINPFAIFLTKCTITPVSIDDLNEAYQILSKNVQVVCNSFFTIDCPKCNSKKGLITQILWSNINNDKQEPPNERIEEIRMNCEICGMVNSVVDPKLFPTTYRNEERRLQDIEKNYSKYVKQYNLTDIIPNISFSYPNGKAFRQIRHYVIKNPDQTSIFTKRNLLVLGLIKKGIDDLNLESFSIRDSKKRQFLNLDFQNIRDLMNLTFSANLGQSSKMVWVISKRKGSKVEKKEVGSWTHHFFWNPDDFFEINPWIGFCTRFAKTKHGLDNLLERISDIMKVPDKTADNFKDLIKSETNKNALLFNQSSNLIPIPDNSVDYIFTDPPYGDSIQYYELSSLWNNWLRLNNGNTFKDEIVVNPKQEKSDNVYQNELNKVFIECYRVLKQNKYLTVTFHNTSISIRNILIKSVVDAGFKLEQILFQMPPRNSLKSYLHYDKTPVGDYYIRFRRIASSEKADLASKHLDKKEIIQLVQNTVHDILIKRAEPTSLIIIYNLIDEMLAHENCYPLEDPKIITDFIQDSIKNKVYILTSENQLWFSVLDAQKIQSKPLTERISLYMKQELVTDLKRCNLDLTYSEIYNRIYEKFNGIDIPDRKLISKLIDEQKIRFSSIDDLNDDSKEEKV